MAWGAKEGFDFTIVEGTPAGGQLAVGAVMENSLLAGSKSSSVQLSCLIS